MGILIKKSINQSCSLKIPLRAEIQRTAFLFSVIKEGFYKLAQSLCLLYNVVMNKFIRLIGDN